MARDRQRKDRAAQRRAERLAQREGDGAAAAGNGAPGADPDDGMPAESIADGDPKELADFEVSAPPEDVGRSDRALAHSPHAHSDAELYEDEADVEDDDDYEIDDDFDPDAEDGGAAAPPRGPRGIRGGDGDGDGGAAGARPQAQKRGRVVAFLVAVWAELQRVQWPDRKQLTQLTGIVLFFVLVCGGYLGLLDAIFSNLIKSIL